MSYIDLFKCQCKGCVSRRKAMRKWYLKHKTQVNANRSKRRAAGKEN